MNIDNYCTFLAKVRGLSESYVQSNRRTAVDFLAFIQKDIKEITIDDVYNYFVSLMGRDREWSSRYYYQGPGKISKGTVRCMCLMLKKYLEWCRSYNLTTFDPKYVRVPKNETNKLDCLADWEIALLMDAPREMNRRDDMYYRDTLLFMVGYYLGLRISEALALSFSDLKQDFITVFCKKKKRSLPIPFKIRDIACSYEKIRGGIVSYEEEYISKTGLPAIRVRKCTDRNPHLVFTALSSTMYGHPMDDGGLSFIFRKYEKFTGIKKRITYHMFRHTFATHLLQSGVDIFTVQQMMGHKNVTSSQHYISISEDQKVNAQAKLGGFRVIKQNFIQNL